MLVFVREMYEAQRRMTTAPCRCPARPPHSTRFLRGSDEPTFNRTPDERRRYPTDARQPIELALRLTSRPARAVRRARSDLARTARHGAWHCLAASAPIECMLGKVQVARSREHTKVRGLATTRARDPAASATPIDNERAAMQARLEHVAGASRHPYGVARIDAETTGRDRMMSPRTAARGSARLVHSVLPAQNAGQHGPRPICCGIDADVASSTARQIDSASVRRPASERAIACQILASRASPFIFAGLSEMHRFDKDLVRSRSPALARATDGRAR